MLDREPSSIQYQPLTIKVVGAGLIGSAIAFALRRAGYAVTVYDAGLAGAAWKAGAGMLTPAGEGLLAGPLADMARESLSLWPQFARDLEGQSGVSVYFREGLERLQTGGCCLRTPGEGQVHPPSVVQAALYGLEIRRELFPAAAFCQPYPLTILATGAFSARFGLPVFPVQGQALLLAASPQMPARFGPPPRGNGAKAYALARPDGVYVGATVRHTASPQPDALAQRWLAQARRRLLPELCAAPITQTLVGLRPCTANGLPIIGPHPTLPGVLVATGHGRHGALLAPWTAQEMLRLVRQKLQPGADI